MSFLAWLLALLFGPTPATAAAAQPVTVTPAAPAPLLAPAAAPVQGAAPPAQGASDVQQAVTVAKTIAAAAGAVSTAAGALGLTGGTAAAAGSAAAAEGAAAIAPVAGALPAAEGGAAASAGAGGAALAAVPLVALVGGYLITKAVTVDPRTQLWRAQMHADNDFNPQIVSLQNPYSGEFEKFGGYTGPPPLDADRPKAAPTQSVPPVSGSIRVVVNP